MTRVAAESPHSTATHNSVTTCPVLSPARIISVPVWESSSWWHRSVAIIIIVKIVRITRMILCSIDRLYCTQYIHTIQQTSVIFFYIILSFACVI